jgi:hypothetical protein
VSHASTEEPTDVPPRDESLARIAAMTKTLRNYHVSPPDAFVWNRHEESHWWAFGDFGRYTVTTPQRFGWAVGDFPWEGPVKHGADTFSSEVFVKPTFVDAAGRIWPIDAVRAVPADNHLLTDEMCWTIAERMEQFAASARAEAERPAAEPTERPHHRHAASGGTSEGS